MSNVLMIEEQGSFFAGGTVITADGQYTTENPGNHEGQTFHGDHVYVSYQKPVDAKQLPIVFLHGAGQSGKTWESTPDGREGYGTLFLRKGYSTYIVDQPRRGRAGNSTVSETIDVQPNDQFWYENFRMGIYPNLHESGRFPKDSYSLDQFLRQITPNTGAYDLDVISDGLAAVFEKIGDGILVTHSQGGGPGWQAVLKSPHVKAVASYEPGTEFVFPKDEMPTHVATPFNDEAHIYLSQPIELEEFKKLTKTPIVIYYGDYISEDNKHWSSQRWIERIHVAQAFAECVNKHGGDAKVVVLPEVGIYGNSHFAFAEKNNVELADMLATWMDEKGLSK